VRRGPPCPARIGRVKPTFAPLYPTSHDNEHYQLQLAQARMCEGNSGEAGAEARTYLLNLLEREPGNAT